MKIKFKERRVIDGYEFKAGQVYELPEFIARPLAASGIAFVPGIKSLSPQGEVSASGETPAASETKPAAKKKKGKK